MPPLFIWHNRYDKFVPAINPVMIAGKMIEYGLPFELHIFQDGPHAMGLADRESARDEAHYDVHAAAWHGLCVDWLRRRG